MFVVFNLQIIHLTPFGLSQSHPLSLDQLSVVLSPVITFRQNSALANKVRSTTVFWQKSRMPFSRGLFVFDSLSVVFLHISSVHPSDRIGFIGSQRQEPRLISFSLLCLLYAWYSFPLWSHAFTRLLVYLLGYPSPSPWHFLITSRTSPPGAPITHRLPLRLYLWSRLDSQPGRARYFLYFWLLNAALSANSARGLEGLFKGHLIKNFEVSGLCFPFSDL